MIDSFHIRRNSSLRLSSFVILQLQSDFFYGLHRSIDLSFTLAHLFILFFLLGF